MKRNDVLKKAKTIINGARAKDYGDAYENHAVLHSYGQFC